MSMKILFIITFIIINLLFSNEKTNISLQLSWLNQFQFAGYYVAKEKGFYKEVGLEVEINEFKDKTDLAQLVVSQKVDFAIGRSSLMIDRLKGNDIIALGAIFQNSPLVLISTNEDIKTIQDMNNKKIMITPDAELTASITAMLNSNEIYFKNLQIQTHSFNIEDLINKKTDIMASYVSNEPIILEEKNIYYKIFDPKDYGFDFYSDILFTSSKFIKENPTTTKNFYEATIKGWEYAFENKTEAAEIIFNKYNTQNKTLINLIKEAEILEKLAVNIDDSKIGCLDEDKLKKILQTFKVLGLVKADLDLNSFIYEHNHHKKIIFELEHEERVLLIMFIMFSITIFTLSIYFVKKLHSEKKLLHAVINSSDDLIYYKNKHLKYLGCNTAFEKFVGKSKSEIIGKNDFELFGYKFAKESQENDFEVLKSQKTLINEESIAMKDKTLLFQIKKIPLKYNLKSSIGILGVNRDITDLFEIQKKLEEQAIIDELTKVYNRKYFNEKLKEQIEIYKRYGNYFCITLLDIDDFKIINDTYGHDVGDKVLIEICKIIKTHIRNTDILFRIGGEEFIILYPKTILNEAFVSTSKLKELINQENIIENHQITVSIGLTQILQNDDETTLFKRIDEFMYFSKKNGKDKITTN